MKRKVIASLLFSLLLIGGASATVTLTDSGNANQARMEKYSLQFTTASNASETDLNTLKVGTLPVTNIYGMSLYEVDGDISSGGTNPQFTLLDRGKVSNNTVKLRADFKDSKKYAVVGAPIAPYGDNWDTTTAYKSGFSPTLPKSSAHMTVDKSFSAGSAVESNGTVTTFEISTTWNDYLYNFRNVTLSSEDIDAETVSCIHYREELCEKPSSGGEEPRDSTTPNVILNASGQDLADYLAVLENASLNGSEIHAGEHPATIETPKIETSYVENATVETSVESGVEAKIHVLGYNSTGNLSGEKTSTVEGGVQTINFQEWNHSNTKLVLNTTESSSGDFNLSQVKVYGKQPGFFFGGSGPTGGFFAEPINFVDQLIGGIFG